MTTTEQKELRKEVKQYIDHADDRILRVIRAILEVDKIESAKVKDEWLEDISDEEKAAIEKGLQQLDNGKGIPHKEAIKQLKWFPK